MVITDIQAVLAKINNKVTSKITSVQADVFKGSYGDIAKKIFDYSKRVLKLEGVVEDEDSPTATATDIMLAKSIVADVKGNGWEGSGQAIMKMFSILLNKNLESKSIGMACRLELPKGVVIKSNSGTIGMISESGNLMHIINGELKKDTRFTKSNQDVNLASEDEVLTFVGLVLSSPVLLRQFSSSFKVSSIEEIDSWIAVSMNGIDNEETDKWEYKKFMVDINSDLTQGVA